MNAVVESRPKSLRVIAALGLLWNLIGVLMFLFTVMMTPEQVAAMPAEQRQLIEATPSWLNVLFGVAVVAGTLGALGLLLLKRWSVPLLLLSLVAAALQVVGSFAATPAWSLLGPSGLVMPALVLLIGTGLWLYARKAATRGWLR